MPNPSRSRRSNADAAAAAAESEIRLSGNADGKLINVANAPQPSGARLEAHGGFMHKSARGSLSRNPDAAGGAATTEARGKQARDNDKVRELAARFGISVRKARRLRAQDPARRERAWNSRPGARRDRAWLTATLGTVRADGSLQHIGGNAVNAARKADALAADRQLFDFVVKVDVPALQAAIQAATTKAGKAASRKANLIPAAGRSNPTARHERRKTAEQVAHADKVAEAAFKAAVSTATPDAAKGWRRYLAAVIHASQIRGRDGWGAFKRGLKALEATENALPADVAAAAAVHAEEAVQTPKRRRRQKPAPKPAAAVAVSSSTADAAARKAAASEAAFARAERTVGGGGGGGSTADADPAAVAAVKARMDAAFEQRLAAAQKLHAAARI